VPEKTSFAVVDQFLERMPSGELRSGDRIDHAELE